jgi:uncharacterized protein YcbX
MQMAGKVVTLWRYPIKSMMGEELNATAVTTRGLLGDRAYALVDQATSKVASAKHPRKWPHLFDFRAAFVVPPHPGMPLPVVRITLPDGTILTNDQSDINRILSQALQREVTLDAAERGQEEVVESSSSNRLLASAEEYWPDMEGLDFRDTVTDFALPEGTFFDCATVHVLLTTATLERLRELYPAGRFEVRRFRPNIVVQTGSLVKDFVENAWIGHTLAIGDEVRLAIPGPCPRCVMTTLPQADLPSGPDILRTAAKHNQVNVGVYASVLAGGTIRRGDAIRVE